MNLSLLAARAVVTTRTATTIARKRIDASILRYDGWFLVLLAVLMVLAVVMATAMALWCMMHEHKTFTGKWDWSKKGVSVFVQCV